MIATREELDAIVQADDTLIPECGAYEASFDAFAKWYASVKDKPSGVTTAEGRPVPFSTFDVQSLLGHFDADLKAYAVLKK